MDHTVLRDLELLGVITPVGEGGFPTNEQIQRSRSRSPEEIMAINAERLQAALEEVGIDLTQF
ncbi:MAG: hypothetical protein WBP26_02550 [Candidatus Saccharimonadales bacterium]